MNKQIEALKLALEGLEKWHFDKDPRGAADYIAAIREALAEQPASKPWVGLDDADLDVCDTDGRLLARYWERVLREKNT